MSRLFDRRPGYQTGVASGRTDQRGFLYIELLIAFALVAVILLAIIPLYILAGRVGSASSDLTLEANFVRNKVEELQSTNFVSITSGDDQFRVGSRLYRRSWRVQDGVPFAGMKTITITVEPARHSSFGGRRVTEASLIRVR